LKADENGLGVQNRNLIRIAWLTCFPPMEIIYILSSIFYMKMLSLFVLPVPEICTEMHDTNSPSCLKHRQKERG